jgi:probable F420-dependent oxidoreductase
MKWGVLFSSTSCPDPERAAALAGIAEEAGFESLWSPEHIALPVEYEPAYAFSSDGRMDRIGMQGGVPDPLVWFAFVAASTTTIKFGTGVVILPEHHPVPFAKSCATLASLSRGRFMLGIGVGWCREEYDAVGASWPNRGRRCEEYIHALRTLWREPEASFDGEFVTFAPVECDPKPPGGTIPIIVGGESEPAARRAGRLADGFFPALYPTERVRSELPVLLGHMRSAAAEAGRDPATIEVTSGGTRSVEGAKWYADQGVHRLTIAVRSHTVPEMREELLRFGDSVIPATADL